MSFSISIHAPRVGGDSTRTIYREGERDFNPRPPCGGRHESYNMDCMEYIFQSTPPVWGATRL